MFPRLFEGRIAVIGVAMMTAATLFAIGLDPTFGQGGRVTTPFPGQQSGADAVLIQPDGRIVAVGFVATAAVRRVALARYDPDGSLDATFGSGGLVVTDAGGIASYAAALALQPDGRILVAGVVVFVDSPGDSSFLVLRYLADGSLDPSFGAGGIVTTDFRTGPGGIDGATSVSLLPDGRIVAGGYAGTFATATTAFALARYQPDGTPDMTFGIGGQVVVDMGDELLDSIHALVALPNGTVAACGQAFQFPYYRIALIRLGLDGSLDPSFGTGGRVYTPVSPEGAVCLGLRLQSDGRLVAFGSASAPAPIFGDFVVLRYLEDGSLDPGFGAGGIALTRFDEGSGAFAGAIRSDGGLVAAGYAFDAAEIDFALAGYRADGQPDTGFTPTGRLTTDFDGGHDAAKGVAVQADGKIVAAGLAGPAGQEQFALVRYGAGIVAVPGLSEVGLAAFGLLLATVAVAVLLRPRP